MPSAEHKSVMIYVQHLLGIGHFRRIWFMARALADRDITVDLVTGGNPVAGLSNHNITIHQLAALRSLDGHFDKLVNDQDELIDDRWKVQRREQLLDLFEQLKPDILITETFPFGRRMMRFELIPLLEAAHKSRKTPLLVASIRDILQPKSKPGRNQEVLDWLNTYYHHVLIHGERKVASLQLTFPFADEVENKLHYTGYITDTEVENSVASGNDGEGEIIVSGGGGAASLKLLQTAIEAKALSKLSTRTWRLLAGFNLDQAAFSELQQQARQQYGASLIVERNRSDFGGILKRCMLSVSQAGYNTVMDILRQQTRAVLVPYAEADEVEQTLRASQLQACQRAIMLEEKYLTPVALAQAIDQAAEMPLPKLEFNLDGAAQSADLIEDWLNV